MTNDYQAFIEEAPAGLERLTALVTVLFRAEEEAAEIARKHKEADAYVRDVAERQIPDLMEELGVVDFTTKGGVKVKLEDVLSVRPKAGDRDAVCDWLAEHGSAGAVKRTAMLALGKDSDDLVKALAEFAATNGVPLVEDRKVESSTLRALVRDHLKRQRAGDDVEPLPEDLFGVYEAKRAKITARPAATDSAFA